MPALPRNIARLKALLPWLYLVGASAALYALLAERIYDDPFITYRYARNLAQGLGFVYNAGERVLSTTTPLFALLLAAASFFTSDLPHIANLVGAVSLAAGALLIWDLAQTWTTPQVGWAALLLYPTFTLPAASLGSETPLYIGLCLAAFAVYARRRYSLAAMFAALAALARPDGILVGAVLTVDYLLRVRRSIPWKQSLVFGLILLPWVAFAGFYFGNPLPVTLAAKQQQGILIVSEQFGPGLLTILEWYKGGWQYWLELILASIGIYGLLRCFRSWGLVLSWPVLYFAAYSILAVSRYFWYYAPLVPGFIILVGLGIATISNWVAARGLAPSTQPGTPTASSSTAPRGSSPRDDTLVIARRSLPNQSPGQPGWGLLRRYAPCNDGPHVIRSAADLTRSETRYRVPLASLAAIVLLVSLAVSQVMDLSQLTLQADPNTNSYRAVGMWLKENTPPDALVGSLEAGVIGYYSERRIVDFAGILQPQVAEHMTSGGTYDDIALWVMQNYAPEYVILVEGDLSELKQAYLDDSCQIVHRIPGKMSGYPAIDIYLCRFMRS